MWSGLRRWVGWCWSWWGDDADFWPIGSTYVAVVCCHGVAYGLQSAVPEVRQTTAFAEWLGRLRDGIAKAKIAARVQRMAFGNMGDVQPVGEGVIELRIHHGPGYRVYFVRRGPALVVLLCGGDKRTQARDIEVAKVMARDLEVG